MLSIEKIRDMNAYSVIYYNHVCPQIRSPLMHCLIVIIVQMECYCLIKSLTRMKSLSLRCVRPLFTIHNSLSHVHRQTTCADTVHFTEKRKREIQREGERGERWHGTHTSSLDGVMHPHGTRAALRRRAAQRIDLSARRNDRRERACLRACARARRWAARLGAAAHAMHVLVCERVCSGKFASSTTDLLKRSRCMRIRDAAQRLC